MSVHNRAHANGGITVAVANVDGLVQENHVQVRVPTVRVLGSILPLIANVAGTKLEE